MDKIRNVSELEGTAIDQVFIGSCTNGRLEDIQAAAAVLKGKKVAPFVKLIVTPASRKVYEDALACGAFRTLAEAGAIITHPGCGLCCGRAGGILSDGERVVATITGIFWGVWEPLKWRFTWHLRPLRQPVQQLERSLQQYKKQIFGLHKKEPTKIDSFFTQSHLTKM